MWVKICANTSLEDALAAAELGADAVGFVFAPSVRQVTEAEVARITPHLPAQVERVGVFPAFTVREVDTVAQCVERAGLSAVQMHGGWEAGLVQELEARVGPGIRVMPAAHWEVGADRTSAERVLGTLAEIAARRKPYRVLVDSRVGTKSGGLGAAFEWAQAREAFHAQPTLDLVLAGGLNPANVGEAIRTLRPWGVDVASGVEHEPGKKDRAKMKAFLEAARGAISP